MNFKSFIRFTGILVSVWMLGTPVFAQKGKPVNITLKVNETYEIKLASTPSTLKVWELGYPHDSTILKFEGRTFKQDVDTAKAGSPGKDIFKFKALKPGQTSVSLIFKGKYEKYVIRDEEYVFSVEK